MTTQTVSPGIILCDHDDDRDVQVINGVQIRACNVCDQTHIVT